MFKIVWRIVVAVAKGIVNALYAILTTVLSFFGVGKTATSEEVASQSNVKEQPSVVKQKHMDLPTFNYTGEIKFQVGVPPNEAVHDHIYGNTVKCYSGDMVLGQFIGLGSDVYAFPKHFLLHINSMEPQRELVFKSAKHGLMATMTVS